MQHLATTSTRNHGERVATYHEVPKLPLQRVVQAAQIHRKLARCLEVSQYHREALSGKKAIQLTIDVVLNECVVILAVVNKLNDLEEVVLAQLHETIGHLVNVHCHLLLFAAVLLELALFVRWERARLAQDLLERLRGVLKLDGMLHLILRSGKVEIMDKGMFSALLSRVDINCHLKFTPSLVGALEGGLRERCINRSTTVGHTCAYECQHTLNGVLERRVQVVDGLGEALGRFLLALLVKNVELNGPLLHGEALHDSGLIAVVPPISALASSCR